MEFISRLETPCIYPPPPPPPPCNKSILPLLKDVVHTFDMQHHLISLFINYTNTLNPQQITAVDCSDQPIYALSKINQWMCPDFSFPRYFPLFGGLQEKALLIANGNLLGGLDNILGDAAIGTIGLETAVLDVDHYPQSKILSPIIRSSHLCLPQRSLYT